jgi:hypothetical protein
MAPSFYIDFRDLQLPAEAPSCQIDGKRPRAVDLTLASGNGSRY